MTECAAQSLQRLFAELEHQRVVDVRLPPDAERQRRFTQGWNDYLRGRSYRPDGLRRLTWRNLGWRAAAAAGDCPEADPTAVYEHLAQGYASGELRLARHDWQPTTREDRLLARYWQQHGGQLHVEVPVGGGLGPWHGDGATRRIDGVRIAAAEQAAHLPVGRSIEATLERHPGADIEVIEVKRQLNRPVIGQTQAGKLLFCARHDEVNPDQVTQVVVCAEGDRALEWACDQLDIRVAIVAP